MGASRYLYNPSLENRRLVVLVHGINCQNLDSYWGAIPQLLQTQLQPATDLLLWKYDTNLGAFDKVRAIFQRRPKMSAAADLGKALYTFLTQTSDHIDRPQYEKIALVGHSQGGLVSLNAAYYGKTENNTLPIIGMCAASMPTFPNLFARIHRLFTLGTNPQTKYLGNKTDYQREITVKLPLLRQSLRLNYISAIGDEVLGNGQILHSFHDVSYIQGGHSWPSEVQSSGDHGFHELSSFLRSIF